MQTDGASSASEARTSRLAHPVKPGKTTAASTRSISVGTLRSIERQSGMRLRRSKA